MTPIEIDIDINAQSSNKTVGDLRKEFKDLNKSIGETTQGTAEYYKQLNRLAEVKGDLQDLKEDIRGLDPGNRFRMIQGTVQGLAGGLTAATGAVALFAGENENLQRILLQVNAAMAVLQGLQAFNDGIRQAKVLIGSLSTMKSVAAATGEATKTIETGIDGATKATNRWGTAFKAIGIGLVLSLLPLVANAFSSLSTKIDDTVTAQKELNEVNKEALKSSVAERVELNLLVKSAQNVNLTVSDRLKEVKELQKKFPGYFEDIRTEKDLNDKLSLAYDAATKGILAKAKATAIFNKIVENENKILELQSEKEKLNAEVFDEFSEKINKKAQKRLDENIKKLQDANKILEGSVPTVGETSDDRKRDEEESKKQQQEAEKKAKEAVDKQKKIREDFSNFVKDQNKKDFDTNEQALIELEKLFKKIPKPTNEQKKQYDETWNQILGNIKEDDRKKILENLKKQQEEILKVNADNLSKEQALLSDMLAKKQISQKEYEETTLANQIKFDQQLVNNSTLSADKIAEVQNRLNENIAKQNEQNQANELQRIKDFQTLAFQTLDQQVADREISKQEAEVLRQEQIVNDLSAELELRKSFGENTLQLESQLSAARIELIDKETEFRKARLQEVANLSGALIDAIGKDTAAGKALSIAQALINTYTGVTEALRQKSTLPSPFDVVAKVVNVATVLATGFKAVKAITSVKIPGGGGAGSSAGATTSLSGGSIPSAVNIGSQAVTTQLSANSLNQLNQQGQTVPVRAYVVESDVTNTQQAIAGYQNSNTLGG